MLLAELDHLGVVAVGLHGGGGDRRRYVDAVSHAVTPGGHAIVATFGSHGPPTCSGLPVHRYDRVGLTEALGHQLALRSCSEEEHMSPAGVAQPLASGLLERVRIDPGSDVIDPPHCRRKRSARPSDFAP